MNSLRMFVCVLLGLSLSGCHEMSLHRLQRLNRGPDYTESGYNFSVPDPVEESLSEP